MADMDLIKVTQLPVIEERLRGMQEHIEKATAQAMSLACTEETVKTVKDARAALNKQFTVLEDQRKAAKAAIMEPYNKFEAIYKECISGPFKKAEADLKAKINATEAAIKDAAEEEVRAYFDELAAAEHVEWLRYEQANVKMDMATAKQKGHNKAREQVAAFVTGVSGDLHTISSMDDSEEIMAEYRTCLSLSQAIATVSDRNRRIEEEKARRAEWEAARQREQEVVQRVEAVAPPVIVDEKVYKMAFTVRGTKEQLKKLKYFMEKEGIKYE